jgi:CxxC motif-containing protein (DUF1111 family)
VNALSAAALASALAAALPAAAAAGYVAGEERPGGEATTTAPRNANVFSQPSANLDFERKLSFQVGNGVFRKQWSSAPSSTASSDGLGPLFNSRACQNCHLKDGRGHPPAQGETASSFLLKLSIPPRDERERAALASLELDAVPEPTYGGQLQTFAVQGHAAEGSVEIAYSESKVELADGTTVSLRAPSYSVSNLGYGPLDPQTMLSPRVAPPMIGAGLLELVPEAEIVARADPDDRDGDGVRGVAARGWSVSQGKLMLGRFGWKAGKPTIVDQAATAFAGDMGLSTPLVHASAGDCKSAQAACRDAPSGDDPAEGVEVTRQMFDLLVFYSRNLAVPARRDAKAPAVLRGKALFGSLGCAACHTPSHVTGQDAASPQLSGQTIFPYTDLLLHDMGEGLADGRPEGLASGRQWRTTPLWGLGLTKAVNGHTFLLHDGRARSVLEAILWHGGEAQRSRDAVAALGRTEREELLKFLDTL